MTIARRDLLARTGLALAAGAVGATGIPDGTAARSASGSSQDLQDWGGVRSQFALSDDLVHMSAMLLSSHPKPVRDAIDAHRRGLDADPVTYLRQHGHLQNAARGAAGRYLGVDGSAVALTDSTTMGAGLVYNGLRLTPEQEILSTEQDYYVTNEAIRLAGQRTGARVRKIPLYEDLRGATADQFVERILDAIAPATRVLALSSTGLKLPVRRIADALETVNAGRDDASRVLLCVDGVHGFGVEDVTLADLGCDLLMAGCHKWLFGPRGTGIVAGTRRGWEALLPTIPSFVDGASWEAWYSGGEPAGPTTGSRMMPGGFKAFEHQWALTQAFEFHQEIGKPRIAQRTHELAGQLKEGLAGMPHVILHTPRSDELSSGIVSFDIDGQPSAAVVIRLRERGIIASVAPYAVPRARLTPCIRNTPAEIETVLREIHALSS
jgi:selenocysteine lyase/cysteine desulfurase